MNFINFQCQNAEVNKSDSEIVNNVPVAEAPNNNMHVVDEDHQRNETTPTAPMINTQNIINHKEGYHSVERISHLSQETQEINSKVETEKKMELNDFPKVQKEHLLEMASAVENVLTNDSESVETNLDCDLVCRNQFLSSYLEEQKKIATKLHIELSFAVSMHESIIIKCDFIVRL